MSPGFFHGFLSLCLLLLGLPCWLAGQAGYTVEQVVSFVRSSIELRHPDKKIADYLRKIKLTQKLEPAVIEDLQAQGAGPRTLAALGELREASKSLTPAPVRAAEPAPAPVPPPRPEEQSRVIERAREYALNYVKRLPDFICTQVTRRYYDPTGMEFWRQDDTITTRLSYFEQKENYKVILVNNRPTDTAYESLGGATSSGEFGSMLRELFESRTRTEFQWERWATLRGRRAHVYSYSVAQAHSLWHVTYQRREDIVPAYHGLVYVDRDTLAVVRIKLEAELPPSFPLQQATTVLDYDFAEIAGQKHMLPLRAEVRMREGKILVKNEVEFRLYRKFSAEATVTFDTPDPLPEEKTKEQPAAPPRTP